MFGGSLVGRKAELIKRLEEAAAVVEADLEVSSGSKVVVCFLSIRFSSKTHAKSMLTLQADWACSQCTYVNRQKAKSCAICAHLREEVRNLVAQPSSGTRHSKKELTRKITLVNQVAEPPQGIYNLDLLLCC